MKWSTQSDFDDVASEPVAHSVSRVAGSMLVCTGNSLNKEFVVNTRENKMQNNPFAQILGLALQIAQVGVWELNILTGHLKWDASMHKTYGFEPGEFPGNVSAWQNCVHPEDWEKVNQQYQTLLEGGDVEVFEFRIFRHNDRELRYIQANGIMQYDENGSKIRVIGTNGDITDQKQIQFNLEEAKKAAEEANRAKSAFLANMSHEIRTPLAVIRGFADLAALKLHKEKGVHSVASHAIAERLHDSKVDQSTNDCRMISDWIARISTASIQLESLVNDILDLSKIEAGKASLDLAEFPLFNFLKDIFDFFSLSAAKKGLEFSIESNGEIPVHLVTDESKCRQILLNLIGNAIKFTPAGFVRVFVEVKDEHVSFCIQDSGIGISEEFREKLFSPFSQAEVDVKSPKTGTGLGLHLSRNLAHLVGGEVNLEPVQSEPGSKFKFQLKPLCSAERFSLKRGEIQQRIGVDVQHSPVALSELLSKKILRELKILVVDDAPELRVLISQVLTQAGAIVGVAENGSEALETINNGTFDCVIMDLQMPIIDGYMAMSILKKQDFKTPVIALTAHAMKGEEHKCRKSGFSAHLSKPVHLKNLIHKIHEVTYLSKTTSFQDLAQS